jgi:dihydroorotase
MPGVQTLLPLMLDHVAKGHMTLARLIDMTSAGVQRIFGLQAKGRIAVGYDADFSIVDRKGTFAIEESWLESRCGWSPYTGMALQGRVIGTIIRGNTVMWEGQLANAAMGEPLRFAGAMAG